MPDKSTRPDFLVQWRGTENRFSEDVYCDVPSTTPSDQPGGKLRTAVASLQTPTTHVEVSEVGWAEPVALTFTPNRPGFTLLISKSANTAIEYGYDGEVTRSARLENVLFMLPDTPLNARLTAGVFRTVTCSFERNYAEGVLGPFTDLSPALMIRSLDVRSSLISTLMLRLMNEALYPGPLSNAVVESFGQAMLVECAHWMLVENARPAGAARLTARHLAIVEDYLAGLSGKLPSVAELAAACGLSERYFSRLFRERTGCSIMQYLKSMQIAKAKAYLIETELPLKEIAFRLGFSTPANFSAAFVAATGITPGKFRLQDRISE